MPNQLCLEYCNVSISFEFARKGYFVDSCLRWSVDWVLCAGHRQYIWPSIDRCRRDYRLCTRKNGMKEYERENVYYGNQSLTERLRLVIVYSYIEIVWLHAQPKTNTIFVKVYISRYSTHKMCYIVLRTFFFAIVSPILLLNFLFIRFVLCLNNVRVVWESENCVYIYFSGIMRLLTKY